MARRIDRAQLTSDGQTLYTRQPGRHGVRLGPGRRRRLGRRFTAGAGGGFNVAQSTDGRLLATGQEDGALSVVDARTLEPRATHPVGGANKVGFVPGSHVVVAAGDGGFAALVDADSGRVVRRLRGHRGDCQPARHQRGRARAQHEQLRRRGPVLVPARTGTPTGMLRFKREIFNSQLSPDGRWLSVSLADADFVERRRGALGRPPAPARAQPRRH